MKYFLALMVIIVYALHQDIWNWKNGDLVFGILPMGLAYHAGFSALGAVMMAVLVKFAWPEHLEQAADEAPDPEEAGH